MASATLTVHDIRKIGVVYGDDPTQDILTNYINQHRIVDDPFNDQVLIDDPGACDGSHVIARLKTQIRYRAMRRNQQLANDLARVVTYAGRLDEQLEDPTGDEVVDIIGSPEIRAAVQTLPDGQRRCFLRHYLDGSPFTEVAYELGIRTDHARQLAQRARTSLAKQLQSVLE